MPNANTKCALLEAQRGHLTDTLAKQSYVWYQQNWLHDDYEHKHQRAQLVYIEEGYQYFHINQKIYFVPQNHLIWIPSNLLHKTTTDAQTVNLMTILFDALPTDSFYDEVHTFSAPAVLTEMISYSKKWSQQTEVNADEASFLDAILRNLPSFCEENTAFQLPIPSDARLVPICTHLDANYTAKLDVTAIAELTTLSTRSIERLFKKDTGMTIQKYLQIVRILKSIELLNQRQFTLSEIALKVGYQSQAAFSTSYFSILKVRPKSML